MSLLRPNMESCERKCRCGADSANPGVVYNCDNPCGRGVPFVPATCDCGVGEGFHEIYIAWQTKVVRTRGGQTLVSTYTTPGWYNGYQGWRSYVGSGGYQNRVYLRYIKINTFGCVSDGNWNQVGDISRGVFDVYFYLRQTDEETNESYFEGRGGCYWPENCDSCRYARPGDPPYARTTYSVEARVTANRYVIYIHPETGRPTRRRDTYMLYYGDMVEGEPGYDPPLTFTDPVLDAADPTRPRVVDLRGQYNIEKVVGGGCACSVTEDMKGPRL